jgi:hypothetical protein
MEPLVKKTRARPWHDAADGPDASKQPAARVEAPFLYSGMLARAKVAAGPASDALLRRRKRRRHLIGKKVQKPRRRPIKRLR